MQYANMTDGHWTEMPQYTCINATFAILAFDA